MAKSFTSKILVAIDHRWWWWCEASELIMKWARISFTSRRLTQCLAINAQFNFASHGKVSALSKWTFCGGINFQTDNYDLINWRNYNNDGNGKISPHAQVSSSSSPAIQQKPKLRSSDISQFSQCSRRPLSKHNIRTLIHKKSRVERRWRKNIQLT